MPMNRPASQPMHILIIGAGIAGLTLAALLHQRGLQPVVIEREPSAAGQGYMLGLYPMGASVLYGLGLHDKYKQQSTSMLHYNIGNGHGEVIRQYSLSGVAQRYGPIRGISRRELIGLLREGLGDLPVRYETTVTALQPHAEQVEAVFSDGSHDAFDLVVAADGLHSDTRRMLLTDDQYAYWNTGWGGWVFWIDPGENRLDTYAEYWGAGRFLGLYPVKDRLGVFIGGPASVARSMGMDAFIQHTLESFTHPVLSIERLQAGSSDAYFWDFHDCRASIWHKGRIVLLGDAATGFIPTAGVGASMALESAAALNDELSRTDAGRVEQALRLYEKRHRQRVEAAQKSSRQMGKMMFVQSPLLAWGRDQLLRFYTVEQLVSTVADIADEPI